jgi:hypothetical protein
VDVLDRLDEVRPAQDEVGIVGFLDLHGDEIHSSILDPGRGSLQDSYPVSHDAKKGRQAEA